ncbi:MAG: glycosyltransferase family 39 protein [Isosphaeraceae bacterium]
MARRRRREPETQPIPETPPAAGSPGAGRARLAAAVAVLLALQWSLAVRSLIRENPTIDEVVHLPAGISYWQKGTFKLYAHNPPLVKLIAAIPAILSRPNTDRMYSWPTDKPFWQGRDPNKAGIAHVFQEDNASDYFGLFTRSRLLMPIFATLGGLAVFFWSRSLHGDWGGLLSLALWTSCPNVLAHARLITTDAAATALGCGATFLFWRYLKRPGWGRALLAALALGLAQLTKFSMLLLFGLWPLMALLRMAIAGEWPAPRAWARMSAQGASMVAIAVLVINMGYGFEGTGRPIGDFPFMSSTLSTWRPRPVDPNLGDPNRAPLYDLIRNARANRFRGTPLGSIPSPLPACFLTGFDEQKLEADGVWNRFLDPSLATTPLDDPRGRKLSGYPVYLDGKLQHESWWQYYLLTLAYKVPEGTWLLGLGALGCYSLRRRAREAWADAAFVAAVPFVTLAAISFGTNINLGLRYILPIFPYGFILIGVLGSWASGLAGKMRVAAASAIGLGLALTMAASAVIHPHYLAYFNAVSGGTGNGSEHLIDSNLDWGQDLVGLRGWLAENAPGEPVGLAYFGQIDPDIFELQGRPIPWFLPPARARTMAPAPSHQPGRPGERVRPGLYAVSASLAKGLDWRVYDHAYTDSERARGFAPYRAGRYAFSYFGRLRPIDTIGGSIFVYRLSEADADRLERDRQVPPPLP